MGWMPQRKDKDWLNGTKTRPLYILSTRDPSQNRGHIHIARKGYSTQIETKRSTEWLNWTELNMHAEEFRGSSIWNSQKVRWTGGGNGAGCTCDKTRILKCQHQNLGDGSMQRCHLAGARGQVLPRSSPSYIGCLRLAMVGMSTP